MASSSTACTNYTEVFLYEIYQHNHNYHCRFCETGNHHISSGHVPSRFHKELLWITQGDDASQWGKREIRPRATSKCLNSSSPKVAYVITSRIYTHTQNLVMIAQRVSFPRMHEIVHQKCLLGFFSSNELQQRPLNRFSHKIRQKTYFHTRMCLFGVRKPKFNI